jgi:hypothetical protein
MSGKAQKIVTGTSAPPTSKSPDSQVSPRTQAPAPTSPVDYFSARPDGSQAQKAARADVGMKDKDDGLKSGIGSLIGSPLTGASTTASASTTGDDGAADSRRTSSGSGDGSERPASGSRKSSTASVSFRAPTNPDLPQGHPRKTDNRRLRESSPSPIK